MKVAVYHNLPVGGALRALKEQINLLSKEHKIDCYTLSSSSEKGYALNDCGVKSNVFDYSLGNHKSMSVFDWIKSFRYIIHIQHKIAGHIDAGGYDVCLTNTCPYFEIPSLHRFLRTPIVYYAHSIANPNDFSSHNNLQKRKRNLNPIGHILRKAIADEKYRAVSCANVVVTNSGFLKDELQKSYKIKAAVNYLGVNTDVFYPEPDRAKGNYVLGVGALAHFKAHDFSIRSLAAIPEQYRPEFWIAYPTETPGEKEYLIWLAAENNVKLKLLEKVSAAALRKLYNNALITLYPSTFEALGLVPLESMSCGTPAVGIAEGGIAETILDSVTGYLTRRDPAEFADAITKLLADPKKISEMGANGRDCIMQNWTWDRSVRQLESLLFEAAGLGSEEYHGISASDENTAPICGKNLP